MASSVSNLIRRRQNPPRSSHSTTVSNRNLAILRKKHRRSSTYFRPTQNIINTRIHKLPLPLVPRYCNRLQFVCTSIVLKKFGCTYWCFVGCSCPHSVNCSDCLQRWSCRARHVIGRLHLTSQQQTTTKVRKTKQSILTQCRNKTQKI